MIALVLLLAPFVDAFWARDLGTLRRELAEWRASQELDGNAGPGPRTGEPTASAAEPSPGTTEPEREPAL